MEEIGMDLIEVLDIPGEDLESDIKESGRPEEDLGSKALTEKMVYLMQKISEYGYLTLPEIELIYANQTYAYKVLGILKDKGLAGDFRTEMKPRKAFYLKPKGYRTLETFGQLRLKRRFLPQRFKPFIFNHRLACAKAGLILENNPLVHRFLPESLLWERRDSVHQKLCDGEFWYKVPDEEGAERVGLEVELTMKNYGKLADSLRSLHYRRDLGQVWWVCGDRNILRILADEVAERPWIPPQRHLFCCLEDFLAAKGRMRLSDPRGAEFSIDPAEPTLRPLKPEPPPPSPPEPEPEPKPAPDEWEPREGLTEAWFRSAWGELRDNLDRIVLGLLVLAFFGLYLWPAAHWYLGQTPAQRKIFMRRFKQGIKYYFGPGPVYISREKL